MIIILLSTYLIAVPGDFNQEVDMEYNGNLNDIVTPIQVAEYAGLLFRAGYDPEKATELVQGFSQGFDIGYRGPTRRQSTSRNIPFSIGNEVVMWNKIMKEVRMGRVAGPFTFIPYKNYMQSPIGLVPKANNQTRLIFHLSFHFNNNEVKSLNFHTPEEQCTVQYKDLDYAMKASLDLWRKLKGEHQNKDSECEFP